MIVKRFAVRHALLTTAAAAALATPAYAQNAENADAPSGGLSEIVVTANKRSENLQKTPIAISAVPAEALELRGLTEAKDLSAIAPNVSIVGATTNATAAVVTIRGIPTPADETQGFDSPIGMYLDGVYLARSSASTFEVADIERVEVLRGPQGTLFGRNTTGGAINFITKKPSSEASLKLRAGAGNYGMWTGRILANSGDMNGLRLSLGYLHRQRNGVVDDLLEPKKGRDPGATKVDSFRGAVDWDMSDTFNVYNVFDYTRIKGAPMVMQLAAVGDGTFLPNVTLGGNTFSQVQPANVAGYLNASTVVEPGCNKTVSRAYRDTVCLNSGNQSQDTIWGNMFRMELNLPTITVRSTTSYRKWWNDIQGGDLDGLGTLRGPLFNIGSPSAPYATFTGFPTSVLTNVGIPAGTAAFLTAGTVPTTTAPLFAAETRRGQNQFSQELEFVSSTDGDFQWVAGAFYFHESGYENNVQNFGFALDTNQAVYIPSTMQSILTGFGYPLATAQALAPGMAAAFQAANPARFRLVPGGATLDYTASGDSMALYGQASYRPGGQDSPFGVTLGLRYTWDSKEVNRTQNGAVPFSAAELALNKRKASFSAPSGHLTLDYRATEDINLYARVARGYRSGGFNLRQSTSVASNIGLLPFNEEKIWSYELGAKMEFMDRIRLNLSAFHNVYSDQLAAIPIPIQGGGSFGTQVVNAGKTTYTGVEVEGAFQISDNFSIDGNFGYIDINIKDFPGADINGVTRNIAPLIAGSGYAPKYTASIAGNFTVPVGDAKLNARLGYNYTSEFEMFPNTLTAPFSKEGRGDARGLLDGQIRFSGFGPNGGMGLTIWGKNLTDKKYVVRSVDFGALGFATVIYGDPRTFGATLDVEF